MPNIAAANMKSMDEAGFGISRLGGHDHGTNGIGVWLSGKVHVGLSDTIDQDFNGVGVIESRLSPDDLKQAKDIQVQLCVASEGGPKNEVEPVEPATVYSVDCVRDGQVKTSQGKTYELPAELCTLVDHFYLRTRNAYMHNGRAIVKLDAKVTSVVPQKENYLISVAFINSGQYPIKMFTPDRWSANFGDQLDVGGSRVEGKDGWNTSLAGLPLVNKSEFPEEIVTIPAGDSVTFKFLTVPEGKVPRGTYQLYALVNTGITGDGVVATMGKVNFRSDTSKPPRVTFDRDYPSTPQEWKDYEARQRAKMSSFPVKPSEAFPEAGHYRLVSNSGQTSRFVFTFRKDAIAPQWDNVQDEHGKELYGMLRWQWEADDALHTFCKVGDPCPREGRWISATSDAVGNKTNAVNPRDLRRFVAGELMPDFQDRGRYYTWYWLGA